MKIKLTESQYKLLIEQGIGKRLAKLLIGGSDEISSSLSKALKSVDPVRATKFANAELDSFSALSKHIDDYSDIWKTIIPDQRQFDNVVDTVTAFKKITEDPTKLKKLQNAIAEGSLTKKQFLQTLPPEGGIYEMFDDLWDNIIENKTVNRYSDISDDVTIVKDTKTNTSVVKSTDNNKTSVIKDVTNNTDTEYIFFTDDIKSFFDGSDNFPKTDTPKDVEVVVGNLKSKNIDYKTLDKHIEDLGIKDWGDKWREFNVDGKPIKFRFGSKGTINFTDKFMLDENNKLFFDLLSDKWKKSNSSKSFAEFSADSYKHGDFGKWTTLKYEDIFEKTDVPGGLRQRFELPDGSFQSYITVNPKGYNIHKSKADFYENLIWVIEHEIGHVEQPAITTNRINQAKYMPYIYKGNTDEVIKHLNKKIDGGKVTGFKIDFDKLSNKMQRLLINDFEKEFPQLKGVEKFDPQTGEIINSDFFEYVANRLNEAKIGEYYIKEIRNKHSVFKNREKASAYRYFFKNYKWGNEPSIRQTIDQVMAFDDDALIRYIENNAYSDVNIKKILYDSAYNLSYLSNRVEIEADFSGLIGQILRKGTDKNNKGFSTWMVDYLKSPNKKELLKGESGPLKIFKKLKGEYPNPIKQKGWDEFKEFLMRLEGPYKSIYPKETKKMYQDLYKQLHELISKGYPALLPFVFPNGLENFDLNEPETQNESIKNFNKIIITESQYKLLKEFKKKAYSFDWDDNILVMPTRIHLDYNVNSNDIADLGSEGNKVWVPVSVSTEQFRSVRHKLGKEFRYPNDDMLSAFKDFRDYDAFIEDTKRALSYRSYGPSFNKFKEALISGSDFSIITARSNPPKAIKEGIKEIIRDMSWGEQKEMEKNLNGLSIDEYLNLQDYHPVSSEEFSKRFGLESVGTSPEEGKKIAFKSFVDRIVSQISKIKDDKDFEGISVGFSDDDEGNIEVIEDLIRDELKRLYPDITFTVYDTSDPKDTKKKRIIIKK